MTVRTHDLALRDLVENRLPAVASDAKGDLEVLASQVIEVEDDRVGLTAVDARMLAEEGNEIGHALDEKPSFPPGIVIDVSRAVGCRVRAFVLGLAFAAVGLPSTDSLPMPRKFICGLGPAATTTTPCSGSF
jgi:hypothetical protein